MAESNSNGTESRAKHATEKLGRNVDVSERCGRTVEEAGAQVAITITIIIIMTNLYSTQCLHRVEAQGAL